MSDEIRRLSELLAHDPSNLAFRQLGELLRQRGELDAAHKVTIRGLEKHTLDAEAHALLARICVDRGELQRAFDEWDMALRVSPGHVGALKGLGFISYRWGRLDEAERYLMEARARSGDDESVVSALASVQQARASLASSRGREPVQTPPPRPEAARASTHTPQSARLTSPAAAQATWQPESASSPTRSAPLPTESAPRQDGRAASLRAMRDEWNREMHNGKPEPSELFRSVTGDSQLQALLVDEDGLVIAGRFLSADGVDRAQEVGAELSGVSEEAGRAMRHLQMGEWKAITFESQNASVAMARASGSDNALVLVASERGAPPGLLRRVLERAQRKAAAWLEGSP